MADKKETINFGKGKDTFDKILAELKAIRENTEYQNELSGSAAKQARKAAKTPSLRNSRIGNAGRVLKGAVRDRVSAAGSEVASAFPTLGRMFNNATSEFSDGIKKLGTKFEVSDKAFNKKFEASNKRNSDRVVASYTRMQKSFGKDIKGLKTTLQMGNVINRKIREYTKETSSRIKVYGAANIKFLAQLNKSMDSKAALSKAAKHVGDPAVQELLTKLDTHASNAAKKDLDRQEAIEKAMQTTAAATSMIPPSIDVLHTDNQTADKKDEKKKSWWKTLFGFLFLGAGGLLGKMSKLFGLPLGVLGSIGKFFLNPLTWLMTPFKKLFGFLIPTSIKSIAGDLVMAFKNGMLFNYLGEGLTKIFGKMNLGQLFGEPWKKLFEAVIPTSIKSIAADLIMAFREGMFLLYLREAFNKVIVSAAGKFGLEAAANMQMALSTGNAGSLIWESIMTATGLKQLSGFFSKAGTGVFGKLATAVTKLGGIIGGSALFKLLAGIGRGLATAGKFAVGALANPVSIAMAGYSAVQGWKNADQVMGKRKQDLTTGDKFQAAAAGGIEGFTFGLLDKETVGKFLRLNNVIKDTVELFTQDLPEGMNRIYYAVKDMFSNVLDWFDAQTEDIRKRIDNVGNKAFKNTHGMLGWEGSLAQDFKLGGGRNDIDTIIERLASTHDITNPNLTKGSGYDLLTPYQKSLEQLTDKKKALEEQGRKEGWTPEKLDSAVSAATTNAAMDFIKAFDAGVGKDGKTALTPELSKKLMEGIAGTFSRVNNADEELQKTRSDLFDAFKENAHKLDENTKATQDNTKSQQKSPYELAADSLRKWYSQLQGEGNTPSALIAQPVPMLKPEVVGSMPPPPDTMAALVEKNDITQATLQKLQGNTNTQTPIQMPKVIPQNGAPQRSSISTAPTRIDDPMLAMYAGMQDILGR